MFLLDDGNWLRDADLECVKLELAVHVVVPQDELQQVGADRCVTWNRDGSINLIVPDICIVATCDALESLADSVKFQVHDFAKINGFYRGRIAIRTPHPLIRFAYPRHQEGSTVLCVYLWSLLMQDLEGRGSACEDIRKICHYFDSVDD